MFLAKSGEEQDNVLDELNKSIANSIDSEDGSSDERDLVESNEEENNTASVNIESKFL